MNYELNEQTKNNLLIFLSRVKFNGAYKDIILEMQELQNIINIFSNQIEEK